MGATEFEKPLDHDIDVLNSKIATIGTISYTAATKVTSLSGYLTKVGRIAVASFQFTMTAGETSNWIDCGTVSVVPAYDVTINVFPDANSANVPARVRISENGNIRVFYGSAGTFYVNVAYRCYL